MSPITAAEAYAATNPDQSEEAREQSAAAIMAGVAANDAYLNSRSELEQIVTVAKGGQVPPPHHEIEAGGAAQVGAVADADTTAIAESDVDAEKAALRQRLAELESGA